MTFISVELKKIFITAVAVCIYTVCLGQDSTGFKKLYYPDGSIKLDIENYLKMKME